MELLESATAFAVAMIIFSTIVTGIVEFLVRLAGVREKNLKNTIESLFNSVIWPRMKVQLMALGADAENATRDRVGRGFIESMLGNPASPAKAGNLPNGLRTVLSTAHEKQIDVLTPVAFAERLGRSEVGKAILAEGEVQLNLLIQDFVRTFDRFGRASSEVFRKKTQQTAIVVGIVFALAVNIHAGRLFTTLLKNPDLRGGLIAQVDEAAKANQEAAKSLAEVSKLVEEGKLDQIQAELLEKQLAKVDNGIKALKGQGLPIGYAYFPFCSNGTKDPACSKSKWQYAGELVDWIALTVLAGILIGLGGPFWFKVFTSLSQLFQMLRALGVSREQEPAKQKDGAPDAKPEETAKPKSILDAFEVAAQVHARATLSDGRALLGPDGQPL